ncbi:phospho-sugar mutase [Nesterenkonia aerolata]|uniref:Phospho-sugar mutase n=1 Tax=Nesterenkonia aerolata TaxID=3074079 RepID=A0ABU2DSA9_9MICC|nr:phospho-sugar mutase [Nesterenkonia sp. LY-0111]MDR8019364.1 phospho-sugar mutase [Nesterenkonia sp. LY-0111]
MSDDQLLTTVRRWIALDPDPTTREQLQELVDSADGERAAATLRELFAGRLTFGTAGLRAALGPGPLRMNRLVVRQTAQGLVHFARAKMATGDDDGTGSVAIGFDARHGSFDFAVETARVFLEAGWQVAAFDRPMPTPVLAQQVVYEDADIGIMVTASHNPPQDNGYKVYFGGRLARLVDPTGAGVGAQITAPTDVQIAEVINAVVEDTLSTPGPSAEPVSSDMLTMPARVWKIGWMARGGYRWNAGALVDRRRFPSRDLRIVYTAMHGVGAELVGAVLKDARFRDVIEVEEQCRPDPDFPTVEFPNPEEPGALDLALKTAERHEADLVLANDPDADRLSAAAYDPAGQRWRQLSGDELGVLLGAHILDRGALSPEAPEGAPLVMANSVVSSRQLGALCAARGVEHHQTLTGFKWLARVKGLSFGYEEAIGFAVDPSSVRDKDGVSAAVVLAELAADLKSRGLTLFDRLAELAEETGHFVTGQVTVRVEHLSQLGEITATLRATPPKQLAGSPVTSALDLQKDPLPGTRFDEATVTDALIFDTEQGDRVIVRPSGTEPKVKCYLEAVAETRALAEGRLEELRSAMEALLS